MPTSKRCGRPIGRAFPRKKHNKSQASQQRPSPLRMWMKPKRLRQPLMRSGIETLHAHPTRLPLRRRQRLLRS
ncbi:hypothetical protein DB830_14800, partial [Xanthomonas perforans]